MDENEGDDEGGIMVKALVYKYAPIIHFFRIFAICHLTTNLINYEYHKFSNASFYGKGSCTDGYEEEKSLL